MIGRGTEGEPAAAFMLCVAAKMDSGSGVFQFRGRNHLTISRVIYLA